MTVSKHSLANVFVLLLVMSEGAIAQDGSVLIQQTGDQNGASIEIVGTGNGQAEGSIVQTGDGAYAEVYIEGDDNNFRVEQTGGGVAYGAVYGSDNSFSIDQINTQSDAYLNYASVLQSGNGNSADVTQQVEVAGGGLNQAYSYQYGNQNNAELTQSGINNTGTVSQTGDDNNAILNQVGTNNTGSVIQNGDGLSGELNQIGNNLAYSVTQSCITGACDQAIIVTQTSTGAGS